MSRTPAPSTASRQLPDSDTPQAERVTGVLAAAIRMMDDTLRAPLRQGHVRQGHVQLRTSSVLRCGSMAQPTIRRDHTSSTTAR